MARGDMRNVSRQISLTESVIERQPMSKSRTNRRDLSNSVEVHRKVMGLSHQGRGYPRTHVRGMSMERLGEVTLEKGHADKLGCSLDRMKITGVENGSVADRYGMQGFIGRTITHVNNRPVDCIEDIKDLTSQTNSITLRFRGADAHTRGRRSVNHKERGEVSTFHSCRRLVRPPNADEVGELLLERPTSTPRRSQSMGIHVPYGNSMNQAEPFSGTVPVLTVPGHAPRIARNGQVSQSLGRFRFPPNLSCEQMEVYGLTPGGNKLDVYRPASPNRKRGVGQERRARSAEPRRSNMGELLAHSNNKERSLVHVSPSRKAGLTKRCNSLKLDLLHHHNDLRVSWTPSSKYNQNSPRAASPVGRRGLGTHDAQRFNPTFLSDCPPASSPSAGRGRPRTTEGLLGTRDHGDIVGHTWEGMDDPAKVTGLRTDVSKVVLPKVVNRYQGPTKKHPVPTPMTSDVFNHHGYIPYSCIDMKDSVATRSKGRQLMVQSPLTMSLQPSLPVAPRSPSLSRRRAHTPAPSPRPPWDTSVY